MRASALIAAAVLVAIAAVPAQGQVLNAIEYTPVSCIRAGELPLLQLQVDPNRKGELRSYFRRLNTTDWCSVEGLNEGPLSRVVLPKFEPGDEIEYFFVITEGLRVVARSPRIYRARVTLDCELPVARHVERLAFSCGDDAAGVGTAAGLSFLDATQTNPSPDTPNQ
jgi:hypothetical protein